MYADLLLEKKSAFKINTVFKILREGFLNLTQWKLIQHI